MNEIFACLKCPECILFSKDELPFRDHALENHPKSFGLFWQEFEEETNFAKKINGKEIDKKNELTVKSKITTSSKLSKSSRIP